MDNLERLREIAKSTPSKFQGVNNVPAGNTIEQNMRMKNEAIARACALNCAAQVTEGILRALISGEVFKNMSVDAIRNLTKTIKDSEYADNLKKLGQSEGVPF